MSSKKRQSSCPFASSKKAPQRKKSGEKVLKEIDQNWADTCAASDKDSCSEHEKLHELDEEDVWHFLSITSLVLSLLEAVTVTSQLNRCLVSFLHVLYEWAVSLSTSKLRRLKTEAKIIFLLTRGPFLEGPEKFSHPESHNKISNLMITELFYSTYY